jgi:hypothetical protein
LSSNKDDKGKQLPDLFLEYFDKWKETYPELSEKQEGEINALIKKADKEYYKCVEFLQEHKHSCHDILEKAVMKTFCALREANYEDEKY